jgi:hypothetical protein
MGRMNLPPASRERCIRYVEIAAGILIALVGPLPGRGSRMSCEKHLPIKRNGDIRCIACGAQLVIAIDGARWVAPRPLQRPRGSRRRLAA